MEVTLKTGFGIWPDQMAGILSFSESFSAITAGREVFIWLKPVGGCFLPRVAQQ